MQVKFYSLEHAVEINANTIETAYLNLSQSLDEQEGRVLDTLRRWYASSEFVFHSSGSTGTPKEFRFSAKQLEWSATSSIRAMHLNSSDHFLLAMDARFVGAALLVIRAALLDAHLSLIPLEAAISKQIPIDHEFTQVSLVPFQLDKSFEEDPEAATKFKRFSCILLGGSALDETLINTFRQEKIKCLHSYGMTETLSHVALRNPLEEAYFTPLKGVQLRLNEDTCLCIKTPALTEELQTTDLAELLADGRFKIVGRKDDVINSGGLKINPLDLEDFIRSQGWNTTLPWLIGWVPDKQLGQKLALITEGGLVNTSDFENLQQICRGYSKPQAIPRENWQIPQFVRTENLKLNRKKTIHSLHIQAIK